MVSVTAYAAGHAQLTMLVPLSGIPALRLLKSHAPGLRVECLDYKGNTVLVPLEHLDLSHESLRGLNARAI